MLLHHYSSLDNLFKEFRPNTVIERDFLSSDEVIDLLSCYSEVDVLVNVKEHLLNEIHRDFLNLLMRLSSHSVHKRCAHAASLRLLGLLLVLCCIEVLEILVDIWRQRIIIV